MHQLFVFLAIFGLVYGAFALHTLGFGGSGVRAEIGTESKDIDHKASGKGFFALAFRVGRPLYWFVMLPIKTPSAALFLAFLMAIPALVI